MKIIYVYDALCGWCYGFSPVITKLEDTYKNRFDFEVISGGMITGSRIGPIGEVAPYISWAYKEVENRTGVKFGNTFLNETLKNGNTIFTSVPPAIALSLFKKLERKNQIRFAAALKKAIYFNGIAPEHLDVYGQIASKFGLDADAFIKKMKVPLYSALAEDDFKTSANLGVSGFPSVFVENEQGYHKIASGYVSFDVLENNLLAILNKEQ